MSDNERLAAFLKEMGLEEISVHNLNEQHRTILLNLIRAFDDEDEHKIFLEFNNFRANLPGQRRVKIYEGLSDEEKETWRQSSPDCGQLYADIEQACVESGLDLDRIRRSRKKIPERYTADDPFQSGGEFFRYVSPAFVRLILIYGYSKTQLIQ